MGICTSTTSTPWRAGNAPCSNNTGDRGSQSRQEGVGVAVLVGVTRLPSKEINIDGIWTRTPLSGHF